MRPTDFFVGVIDFFAALLPGALATWLVLHYVNLNDLKRWSFGNDSPLVRGLAFGLISYILGHFAFAVGAWLDPVYDAWRQRRHPHDSDSTFQAADALRADTSRPIGAAFSTFKWARAYITIHASHARAEIDGLEANSKFFRTLVVVFGVATAHFLLHEQRLDLAAVSAALSGLSFWRYCDQRWKLTELSFATAVILHATKLASKMPGPASPVSGKEEE